MTPNQLIEQTNNGGQRSAASTTLRAPLFAAHRQRLASTMRHAILLVLLLFIQHANAQVLWGQTMYGNTVDQVLAKVSGSSVHESSEELVAAGFSQMISAPVELVGKRFTAFMYLRSHGLEKVILVADNYLGDPVEAEAVERNLSAALKQRYGNASRTEDPAKAVLKKQPLWIEWRSKDTEILLVLQHNGSKLKVAYQLVPEIQRRTDAERAKKLRNVNSANEAKKL